MTAILSAPALAALAASYPAPEEFGPHSDRPCLAIALYGMTDRLAPWLRTLPCPVIGIGEGALGPACDLVLPDDSALATIARNIAAHPLTAMILVQHLRSSESLPMADALIAESLAYATVQMGAEFQTWRQSAAALPPRQREEGPPLLVDVREGRLLLRFNRPAGRNAIDVPMRDALCEALRIAMIDPAIDAIELSGAGRCFSVGGDVAEFGTTTDPAQAHWIRSLRLPATALAQLGERLRVLVQGAAIGAGTEIAAFASRVEARPDAWFQLPELQYGLLPGAGGTVSVARRIGRQRTAYMALSMRRISAPLALEWGLVDAIVP